MAVAQRLELVTHTELEPGGAIFTPRLSDKILSAFTHAYAAGQIEIAEHLRQILESNERNSGRSGRKTASAGNAGERAANDPVARADQWVVFVEARNRYRTVTHRKEAKPADVERALDRMKDAYRRWTQG